MRLNLDDIALVGGLRPPAIGAGRYRSETGWDREGRRRGWMGLKKVAAIPRRMNPAAEKGNTLKRVGPGYGINFQGQREVHSGILPSAYGLMKP